MRYPQEFVSRLSDDTGVPSRNLYNHAWMPQEVVRRREEKKRQLQERGVNLSHLSTEGTIPLTTYGRQHRLNSICEHEMGRDKEREVERGASNPRDDNVEENGRERSSSRDNRDPPKANERNVDKELRASWYETSESPRHVLGMRPFYRWASNISRVSLCFQL